MSPKLYMDSIVHFFRTLSIRMGWLILLLSCANAALAQFGDEGKKVVLNGYLVNMQSVSISRVPDSLNLTGNDDPTFYSTNLYFQNRLNAYWYASQYLTVSAQMRNRLLIGDQVRYDVADQVKNGYASVGNWWNPSWNIAVGNAYILNLAFDRIYMEYNRANWNVTLGKQRINWGKTFAFNPNDMFNTYAYFDFDYEEKPGTDAIRAMYYTGVASSVEVAANIDSANQVSAALKWNANAANYDFQVLGGVLKDRDLALGFGWSGYIGGAGFRGELGYYHPFTNFMDTAGVAMLSTGVDYNINAKWMVQAEVMLAKLAPGAAPQFTDFYQPAQSVKDLATSPFQLLGSVMYQASPLSSLSMAAIWYPHKNIQGIFIGPSWTYSLANNFSAAFYWQFFHGKIPDSGTGTSTMQTANAAFLRLKYSF